MIDFSTPFQDFNYSQFLQEFFPEDLILQREDLVKQSYQKYITNGHILGTVKSLNLSILEFRQTSEHDPRVSLAKEAFRIMADHRIRRGLVIFWNPQTRNWRLSLMTISLDIDEKNNIVRNYSNAKRFSFLLGEGEAMKTPRTQLSTKVKNFEDLQKRFSVEVVRKEFFDDYIELFIRLYIEISKDESFIKVLSEQGIDRVKFTKNLLGKIIFIYFVQKKGWLGLDRDGKWGQGDKNFMRSLWNRFAGGDTFVKPTTGFFYNDYLEHLFYNGFNKDRRDDDGYEPNMKMKVPYLNGGLFKEDYRDWEHFIAKISNDIFSNGKNGILDIFDTYNFTIDEDDLTDAEIAVDPEMLGKIFEKMISVSHENIDEIASLYNKGKVKIGTELNKKFGAFYTPREIVHYMTRESLIAYLSTNLSGKKEENELKIRRLIDAKDQHLSRIETIQLFGNDTGAFSAFTQETDIYLQKVKIIDPAVGSGAFPMGILHEITTLRYYLHSEGFCTIHHAETEEGSEELTENGHISFYQIKRETIKNSIYGIDIEPGAIDIARLRFWLSLVVDAEHPEPLPNFEFKFVCANTLIPLDNDTEKKQMEFGMLEEANLKTVKKYKREYYNADTKAEKNSISTKLREYTQLPALRLGDIIPKRSLQIDEFGKNFDNSNHSHSFFDSSLMISEWRGFDIVIGNPPYIKEYDNRKAFDGIRNLPYYVGKMDIWYFFACLGIDMLKDGGIESFIAQNNWITSFGAKILRNKILEDTKIKEFIDFGDFKVFQDVGIQTMIYILEKTKNNSKYQVKYSKLENKDFDVNRIEEFLTGKIGTEDYKKHPSSIEKIRYINNTFDFADEVNELILEKIYNQGSIKLNEKEVANGIHHHHGDVNKDRLIILGKNYKIGDGIFVLNKQELELLALNDFEKTLVKPDYSTEEIGRYFANPSNQKWTIYTDSTFKDISKIESYPNIKKHLDQFKEVITSDNKPYGLHRSRDEIFFKGEKIIAVRKCAKPSFSYVDFDSYVSATFYVIKTDRINLKFLTGLLNSKIIEFWLKNKGKMQGNNFQLDKEPLVNIPIKAPQDYQPFTVLVDKILESKKLNPKANTSDFEKQIDELVYELYGLTEQEIKIIESK